MRIAIPYTPDTLKNLNSRLGTTNPSRESRNSGRLQNRGQGRPIRRKSSPRPTKTAAELDAELDAYIASSQASSSLVSSGADVSALAGGAMEE